MVSIKTPARRLPGCVSIVCLVLARFVLARKDLDSHNFHAQAKDYEKMFDSIADERKRLDFMDPKHDQIEVNARNVSSVLTCGRYCFCFSLAAVLPKTNLAVPLLFLT